MATAAVARTERNWGIDLLRLVAMFGVLMIHQIIMTDHGSVGSTDPAIQSTGLYKGLWALRILVYPAVNIFALISGYVGYREVAKPHKYSSIIQLWMQAAFYCFLIALTAKLLVPEAMGWKDVAFNILPLSHGGYWYLNSYILLFMLMPVINAGVRQLSNKQLKGILIIVLSLISLARVCGFELDVFQDGRCAMWLMVMYFMGAVVKKCKIGAKLKIWQCLLGILAMMAITTIWKIVGISFHGYGYEIKPEQLVNNLSPTMIACAFYYVILFSKLELPSFVVKLVKFAAPGAFAAFLLNSHWVIWRYILPWMDPYMHKYPTWELLLVMVAFCLAYLITSVVIDWLRRWLFKLVRLDKLADWLEKSGRRLVSGKAGSV